MISIAIPSSALINEKDEKIKAYKVGQIARAAAVFKVREIIIYHDPKLDESEFIADILEYLEMPQYLRRHLIPIKPSLRYAGVLPPLRIRSHTPKDLKIGEVREGVIRKVGPEGTAWVDIGVKALALLKTNSKSGARVTVRVCSKKPLVVEESKPVGYWGYKVKKAELGDLLRQNVVVASRKGSMPGVKEITSLENPVLIFGSPQEGVHEIASRLGVEISARCWNLIPRQGVETVRLEEAVTAALAIINFMKGGMK